MTTTTVGSPRAVVDPVVNGGFELGATVGWAASGTVGQRSGAQTGAWAGFLGAASPTAGDSTLSQAFVVPTGAASLGLWFRPTCLGTVSSDWATVTLVDHTAGSTATVLRRRCANTTTWSQVTFDLRPHAGHRVTLRLVNHDDNALATPSRTRFDDVTVR